jgi:hypothetical protein
MISQNLHTPKKIKSNLSSPSSEASNNLLLISSKSPYPITL